MAMVIQSSNHASMIFHLSTGFFYHCTYKFSLFHEHGYPSINKDTMMKCIVIDDDLYQMFLIKTCHKVKQFNHHPKFLTFHVRREFFIHHFVASSQQVYKMDQSTSTNTLSSSLHKYLTMNLPSSSVFEGDCFKTVILRLNRCYTCRDLCSPSSYSIMHLNASATGFPLRGVYRVYKFGKIKYNPEASSSISFQELFQPFTLDKKFESYLILPWIFYLLSIELILPSRVDLNPRFINGYKFSNYCTLL